MTTAQQARDDHDYVAIGFCLRKMYTPGAWRKAMKGMKTLIELGHAEPWDYGWGKGKFRQTNKSRDEGFEITDLPDVLRRHIRQRLKENA